MSEYKPKPFTKELAEQMKVAMTEPFDEKRTLCNVLKSGVSLQPRRELQPRSSTSTYFLESSMDGSAYACEIIRRTNNKSSTGEYTDNKTKTKTHLQ